MIESVEITNFQGHQFLKVEFDKKVTTLTAPSDTGKSAIIRAMLWALLNESPGSGFTYHGEKTTTVKVVVCGEEIERQVSSGTNIYRFRNQEYKAFGREVPEPIKKFVAVSLINFQDQHDAPFWFSESAGYVSRELNKIVNLELMDLTMKNLNSKLRKEQVILKDKEDRLKQAREKRKELSYVPQLKKDVDQASRLSAITFKLRENYCVIDNLIKTWGTLAEIREMAARSSHTVAYTIEKGSIWNNKQKKSDSLENTLDQIKELQKITNRELPSIQVFQKLNKRLKRKRNEYKTIKGVIEQSESLKIQIQDYQKSIASIQIRIDKDFEGVCPLCGNQM